MPLPEPQPEFFKASPKFRKVRYHICQSVPVEVDLPAWFRGVPYKALILRHGPSLANASSAHRFAVSRLFCIIGRPAITSDISGHRRSCRRLPKSGRRDARPWALYPANDLNGHIFVKNRSGVGYHRVHRWTGRLPASWERWTRESRFRNRGNR